MKGTNIFILAMLAMAAIVGTVILIRRTRAEAAGTDGTGQPAGGNTGGNGTNWSGTGTVPIGGGSNTLNYNLVLKKGSGYLSNNAEVKELQRILNTVELNSPLVLDGKFWDKTEAKLKRLNGGFGEISLAAAKIKWPFS